MEQKNKKKISTQTIIKLLLAVVLLAWSGAFGGPLTAAMERRRPLQNFKSIPVSLLTAAGKRFAVVFL